MVYKRIRDLREDKDMTQTQISQILHCSQRIYSNYERGGGYGKLNITNLMKSFE